MFHKCWKSFCLVSSHSCLFFDEFHDFHNQHNQRENSLEKIFQHLLQIWQIPSKQLKIWKWVPVCVIFISFHFLIFISDNDPKRVRKVRSRTRKRRWKTWSETVARVKRAWRARRSRATCRSSSPHSQGSNYQQRLLGSSAFLLLSSFSSFFFSQFFFLFLLFLNSFPFSRSSPGQQQARPITSSVQKPEGIDILSTTNHFHFFSNRNTIFVCWLLFLIFCFYFSISNKQTTNPNSGGRDVLAQFSQGLSDAHPAVDDDEVLALIADSHDTVTAILGKRLSNVKVFLFFFFSFYFFFFLFLLYCFSFLVSCF